MEAGKMKAKRMSKTTSGVLVALLLLSLATTAQAALSPNILVKGDFTSGSIIDNKTSGLLNHGVWYGSGSKWDWMYSHGSQNAYASLGSDKTQNLFQAVQVSQSWPGHTATAGPAVISFDYQSHHLNTASTFAKLYGSNIQPTYSSTYTGLGTLLGTLTGFASDENHWTNNSLSFDAAAGYAWYTLVITGSTPHKDGAYFKVDNVSVQVTPIPTAAWLLATGLIGLVGVRRRWFNN
jgi:hypothetical protein